MSIRHSAIFSKEEPIKCSGPTCSTPTINCSLLLLLLLSLIQLSGPVAAILSGALPVDWDQFGVGVAFLIGGEVVRRPIFCLLRVLYLRRVVGLSDAEIADIVGTRLSLPQDWLPNLLADPRTKTRIKVCDVLFRKGGHVFTLTSTIIFNAFVVDDLGALVLSVSLGSVLLVMVQASAISLFRGAAHRGHWWWLSWLFGAADRIRDGRLGQQNAMMGSTSMMWGIVASFGIALLGLPPQEDAEKLWALATQLVLLPLTYGDAMGEIIGTPFGRHRFKVKGLGEINEKSLEGCAAVFLGSLIPGLIVLGTGAADPCAIPAAWGLAAAIAVLTAITETVAFRSTDNFVIPACNAVLVVIWWHVGLAVDEGNDAYDVLDSLPDSGNQSFAMKSPVFGKMPAYALIE
mmetsp:Transcript_39056/g.126246  ORF Transcript_39056/g.126246 Transcript_39056/m.126246 type:complete len:403 (+) Transcript_39056:61-1269(+)